MSKFLVFFTFFLAANLAVAQQVSHYSQYMHNAFLLNPATTGLEGYLIGQISNRSQWVGFEGGPKTNYISVQAEIKGLAPRSSCLMLSRPAMVQSAKYYLSKIPSSLRQGIGGAVISDQFGLFSKISGYASYALHLPINVQGRSAQYGLSIGISTGLSTVKFNSDQSTIPDPTEESFIEFTSPNSYVNYLDMNAGIRFYSKKFWVGYSSNQLLKDQVSFGDVASTSSTVDVHHFFTGGYNFILNDDFIVISSIMAKMVSPSPVSFDINAKVLYKRYIWAGISYRHQDAATGLLGITLSDKYYMGYSYDMTISDLKNYNSGSHEIILGIRFKQAKGRGRVNF